jgi:predicted protein tyrosine phosphatase
MILIAPLSKTSDLLVEAGVTHAMSLLSPGSVFPELALDAARHLRLEFHDIAEERQGYQAPSLAQMESILRFVGDWDRKGAMLIHCWAGVSRSTASAYAAMCLLHRQADEFALAAELRAASPEGLGRRPPAAGPPARPASLSPAPRRGRRHRAPQGAR